MHVHNSIIFMVVRQNDSLVNWLQRNVHNFISYSPGWILFIHFTSIMLVSKEFMKTSDALFLISSFANNYI